MPNVCLSCNSSKSEPSKFLLRCVKCGTSWHHRCHKPPVSDRELIGIITQFNSDRQAGKKDPVLVWRCGACSVNTRAQVVPVPPKREVPQASIPSPSTPKASISCPRVQHEPIIIDDDDEIVVLENPQVQKITSTKQAKHAVSSFSAKSVQPLRVDAKQIGDKSQQQKPPPSSIGPSQAHSNPRTSSSTASEPAQLSRKTTTPIQLRQDSTLVPNVSSTSTGTSTITRPTGIRIIDDPFIEPSTSKAAPTRTEISNNTTGRPPLKPFASSSSSTGNALVSGFIDLTVSTNEEGRNVPMQSTKQQRQQDDDDSDGLEYLTPPAPAPAAPPPRANALTLAPPPHPPRHTHTHIAQSLPPIAAISEEPPARPLLIPAYINTLWTAPDAEPDIWQRAAQRRLKAKSSKISAGSLSGSSSSRKFRARSLSAGVGMGDIKPSQVPFFFSVDVWLKQKKESLPVYSSG